MISEYPPDTILDRDWFQRSTLEVARELLGKIFVRRTGRHVLAGRIVEVEAYHQREDEASHTYRGVTERNKVMFEAGGVLYVYFIYGMHYCMNVVTEHAGVGAAVLIRALEPLHGLEVMRARRGKHISDTALTSGPARCCQAFGINRKQNGLLLQGPELAIHDAPLSRSDEVVATKRIGITRSRELEWRFVLHGSPHVSRFPPA